MQEILLSSSDDDGENAYIAFDGGGHDNVGQFSLNGQMDKSTGLLHARKTYAHGLEWKWSGSVTPFGIVGGKYQRRQNSLSARESR